MAVAEYQLQAPNGDILLAREYLERVASSNTEEASHASELLKAVKATVQEKAMGEVEGRNNDKESMSSLS